MKGKILMLALFFTTGLAWGNPFFAMDTAVRDLHELDTVKALGYDGISWKTGTPAEVTAAVEAVRRHGLKLFAVYSYQTAELTSSNLEVDPRLESVMKVLAGTDAIIWLPINSSAFPVSSSQGDAIAVPALRRLADVAASHGLRVAIYPHQGCWTERVQDALRVAKAVNRTNFGVTFNLCHCLMVGDEAKVPQLLTEAAPYLFLVTINGADSGSRNTDWSHLIRPLDEGSYDVKTVLEKLKELHYQGPIGLQAYDVQIPVKDNLGRSMTAWHRINIQTPVKVNGGNPDR